MDDGSDPKTFASIAGVQPGFTLPRLQLAGLGDMGNKPQGRTSRVSGATLFADTPLPEGTKAPQPLDEAPRDDAGHQVDDDVPVDPQQVLDDPDVSALWESAGATTYRWLQPLEEELDMMLS